MRIWRSPRTALRALAKNPRRATRTTLGSVSGVGSVIAMMEIGAGSPLTTVWVVKGSSSQIQKDIRPRRAATL